MRRKMNGKLYKELVRKAIGERTQKDFSAIAGLSPYGITRLLTSPDEKVPTPRMDTIRRIAGASEGRVTEAQLLAASGLEIEGVTQTPESQESKDPKEHILNSARMIQNTITKMAGSAMKYDSINTFLETAAIMAGQDSIRILEVKDDPDFNGSGVLNSESLAHCTCFWKHSIYECKLYLSIHYCNTAGSGVIVSGAVFDLPTLIELHHGGAGSFLFRLMEHGDVDCSNYSLSLDIGYDADAAKKLLEAIFRD